MAIRKSYQLTVLVCPRCEGGCLKAVGNESHDVDEVLCCQTCRETYSVVDGIPQLLKDPSLFTHLEAIDYDDHHNIDDVRREKVARDWKQVFDQSKPVYGDVLEIGSGTGQLTWGLAHRFPFMSVSACDISTKFLQKAANVVGEGGAPVRYYACDANFLPFRDGSFDMVVGHSVLHHFIDYQKIIHRLSTLLRPGGQAIFYEPVLQGKMIIAFIGDLMRRIERRTEWGVLSEADDKRINHMTRHIMKAKWIGTNRERLEKIEDKYIFDIHDMRQLAKDAGFSAMEYCNVEMTEKGYRHYVNQHLLMEGLAPDTIQQFAFIANAYMSTIGEMTPRDIVTPMGYFIFRK
ncbi:MAG: methyltransferase domain-containing protein [Pseudomonadales bacterium]|jgi:ubiquinone/menaquinone biosynthesis C-methylase UbiE/uncharacterized protein YbaR (Trm112 family)